jgi:tetratricopeptide (TPR) repeat protein
VEAYERYLRLPGGSPNERSYARRALARRLPDAGSRHLFAALNESPHEPEVYVAVAERAWAMNDAVGTLYWARQAVACNPESMSHTSDPTAYGDAAPDIACSAAMRLGRYDEALKHAREALRRSPGNELHARNVQILETMNKEDGPKAE